ncbi:hypothetical protein YPPY16_3020, partial [Yersinia pestis PY-16]
MFNHRPLAIIGWGRYLP